MIRTAVWNILVLFFCNTWGTSSAAQLDVIHIPGRSARDLSAQQTHFYFKYQSPSHFNVSVSNIYIRVPGLRTYFTTTQPTLFEINYQGSCEVHKGKGVHIKLLVDDHLIVGDRRTPNVPQRHLLADPNVGETVAQFDQWLSQHHLPFELATLPIVQSAVVLVGPGLHIFDIGVHHGDIGLSSVIFGGTMRFKWTVLNNPEEVQGLTMWTKTSAVPSG
jgi:hypothetical protein